MKIMVQAHRIRFSAFIKAKQQQRIATYCRGPPRSPEWAIVCGSSNQIMAVQIPTTTPLRRMCEKLSVHTGNQTYANNAISIMNYYARTWWAMATSTDKMLAGQWCPQIPFAGGMGSQKWPRAAGLLATAMPGGRPQTPRLSASG